MNFIVTITIGSETLKAWTKTEMHGRVLLQILSRAEGVNSIELHKKTGRGLELLVSYGEIDSE